MLQENWVTLFSSTSFVDSEDLKDIAIAGSDLMFLECASIFLNDLLEGFGDIWIHGNWLLRLSLVHGVEVKSLLLLILLTNEVRSIISLSCFILHSWVEVSTRASS